MPEAGRAEVFELMAATYQARQAGLTGNALAAQVRASYARNAEYLRRGVATSTPSWSGHIVQDHPSLPCAGPMFQDRPRLSVVIWWLGSSIGNSQRYAVAVGGQTSVAAVT